MNDMDAAARRAAELAVLEAPDEELDEIAAAAAAGDDAEDDLDEQAIDEETGQTGGSREQEAKMEREQPAAPARPAYQEVGVPSIAWDDKRVVLRFDEAEGRSRLLVGYRQDAGPFMALAIFGEDDVRCVAAAARIPWKRAAAPPGEKKARAAAAAAVSSGRGRPPAAPDGMMAAAAAAAALGVDPVTIRKWGLEGKLKLAKRGRFNYVSAADVRRMRLDRDAARTAARP